ncbi:GntR family transcriptional regulator [Frondihabitans australicus]|uniref:DNA-binding GntR family transcriptional regulator n=1 Tax=Frondihabitans australicus TaxID=386892 RepID=A0A495ILS5_9MICO|nr:GntR family transcriptional regulator [Frondihabitans australicus]RKR76116.1 DNA-binding GntR family transcriptional regulator [Frondihabitans australicus]
MPVPRPQMLAPRRLLRDQIREELLEAILNGTLEPGERLVDDELVEWLGCSRTPIREALNDLMHAGFIEIEPNKYTRVAQPRDDEAFEVLQTLGVLYGGAVRLAVGRLDDTARDSIVMTIDAARDDLASHDALGLNARTIALFDLFVDACGNSQLQRVCRDITAGLAYRLRLPNLFDLLDMSSLDDAYSRLRQATVDGDAIGAELAAEALHRLPAGALV